MAFMMPVMKNNYDIYKDSRSRKTSECSDGGPSSRNGTSALSAAMGNTPASRVRKVSDCKSESFTTSPTHNYRMQMQMQRCQSQRTFPRNASRSSHSSAAGALSPPRSFSQASSPPKTGTSPSETNGEITKFHLRLVDKLRKSFRKDSAKRS